MDTDAGFLQAIQLSQDHDPVWSIFADWLEERGDPRASFVRHQAWIRTLSEQHVDRQFLMRWCPPGKFVMGSPTGELGHNEREQQVEVELTQGYWIGQFPITQREYQNLIEENPSAFSSTGSMQERLRGQDTWRFPVETVSWYDAVEFCQRLTDRERAHNRLPHRTRYDLPTEAQWEYACRAGTSTATSFGDQFTLEQINYRGDTPESDDITEHPELGLGRPSIVGSYPANAWGLFDMHGNVCEWCRDAYRWNLPGGKDPLMLPRHDRIPQVFRGGCYQVHDSLVRSACRIDYPASRRRPFLGFRIVLIRDEEQTCG